MICKSTVYTNPCTTEIIKTDKAGTKSGICAQCRLWDRENKKARLNGEPEPHARLPRAKREKVPVAKIPVASTAKNKSKSGKPLKKSKLHRPVDKGKVPVINESVEV